MSASIRQADGRLAVTGNMTLETATQLLAAGLAAITGADACFDLAEVSEIDSSGLAVLFGWRRAAEAQGKILKLAHPPANLVSLAEVYGVTDLLPSFS